MSNINQLQFAKYHGAGNDFIMINGFLDQSVDRLDQALIESLCHRRFGVGADGLIVVKPSDDYDFSMLYYNADGRLGSLCGNGGRCAFRFAHDQGIVDKQARFLASDGAHTASFEPDGLIKLSMTDVTTINQLSADTFTLDTGSPHYVEWVSDLEAINAFEKGRSIRFSPAFVEKGINVNFAQLHSDRIDIQTYERGVEGLTYACGTGVTAVALVAMKYKRAQSPVTVVAKGGTLRVEAAWDGHEHFSAISLIGPAAKNFEGTINLPSF